MTIAVIGLGLIGASLAYALKGFHGAVIAGMDLCPETRQKALKSGAVSAVYDNTAECAADADLIILCIYPEQCAQALEGVVFKDGALVTDVCGVKTWTRLRELLPGNVDYVSCHPMAGKEVGGFDNADPGLFNGAGFIVTPDEHSKPENIEFIESMGRYIGSGRVIRCAPETHDQIIAYTSHLCHLSAVALCMDYPPDTSRVFMGGSFRDCARVANINPSLWSSLLLQNRENVLNELTRFQNGITMLKNAIEGSDAKALYDILGKAGKNKRELMER